MSVAPEDWLVVGPDREGIARSREEVYFIGSNQQRMFACTHIPEGTPLGGVVICPPLEAETRKSGRKEVLLARALSERGFAVQRFHYRGSGNSDGRQQDVSFDSMRDDALANAGRLTERAGIASPAFLGTRFGGMVAAAAARSGTGPVAFWEPVVDGRAYFREILRARVMAEMKAPVGARMSTDDLIERIRADGEVDVLGYPVHRTLYESALVRSLGEELGEAPRPILLVQVRKADGLSPAYSSVVDGWRALGSEVRTELVSEEVAWWFGELRWEAEERREATRRILSSTTDWFSSRAREWAMK